MTTPFDSQASTERARELHTFDKRGDTLGGDGSTLQAQGQSGRDAWTQPQQSAPVSGGMDDIPF